MICDKLLGIPLFILLSCTYTYRPILAFRRDGVEKRIYPNSGGSSLPLRNAVEYRPPPSFDYSFNEQHLTRDAPMVPHVPYQQLKYSPDIPDSQLYTSTWWAKKSSAVRSPDPENGKNIYCFYESWSAYRKPPAAFSADNIDPFLCTHILYAFARVNSHSNKLVPVDEEYDIVKGGYRSIVFLKRTNPRLKILLSVGGPLSNMTSTAANRRTFILSAVRMLQEYGFDGLDLHWEFPGAEDLGGRKEDKEHLSQLVEEMSDIFEARGLILVASVSPSRFRLEDGYDVPRLSQHLKHILLKSFDFHNERNGGAVHHSPLTANSEQDPLALYFNVDYAVRYWLKRGVKREQLILGIPFYGRSYTLKHSSKWTPGSPTLTTGKESRYTQQPGFMAYYEVCEQINDDSGEWRLFRDNAGAPFMVMDDQWVGYEDPVSIQIKAKYLRQQGLGGAMIWSVDLDDFHGRCGQRYPLLTTIKAELDPKSLALQWWNLALTQGHGNTNTRIADESGCSRGQFAPHPTNCNKYLQCQWGLYEIYSCPPSLHWNANRQICDWPQSKDGTCALSPGEPGGETESTESNVIPSSKPTPSTSTVSTTTQQEWTWVPPSTTEWSWTTPKPKPKPPKQPTPPHPTLSGYYKVVCYFTNWAWYRQGIGKYLPEDIDGNLCTHVLYGFSVLDSENLIIKAHDSWADFDNRFYERVVAMREKGIKVLLALGGWNDSLGDKYSRLVNNAAARQRFVQHALQFLLKYDFDGLDLDWEYPKCWQVNCEKGPDSDKQNFGLFVKEIKDAFRPHDLLLSAAVSPSKAVIDAGYDVKALAENLDWISVMTYDYHGQWDKKTGHVAPMYYHPDDEYDYFNANFSLNYWISEGVPPRKLVMGMPMYGQSFRLADSANHGLNALAPGPGEAGEQTRAAGFLAYYEICDKIKNGGWTVVKDEERRMGPYAYKGDQWVSFDDQEMIKYKSEFIREMGLGGGMIWALDLDDFRNTCGGGTHPLLKIIANTLSNPPDGVVLPKPSTTTRKPHNVTESTTAITMTTTEMTDNMSEEIYAVGYKSKQNLDVLCYLQPNFAGCKNHSRK